MADTPHDPRLVAGLDAAREGRWHDAVAALTPLVSEGIETAAAALALARALDKLGDTDGASAARDRAFAASPDDVGVLVAVARAARDRGAPVEAIALARRAVAQAPHRGDAWQILWEADSALGRHPEAVEALHHAVALAPADASLHHRAARTLRGHRDLDAAAEVLARGLVADPTHAGLLDQDAALATATRAADAEARILAAHDAAPDARRTAMRRLVEVGAISGAERLADTPGERARFALWRGDLDAARELATADTRDDALVRVALAVMQARWADAEAAIAPLWTSLQRRRDPSGWITRTEVATWWCALHHGRGDRPRALAWGTLAMSSATAYSVAAAVQRQLAALTPSDDPDTPVGVEAYDRLWSRIAPLADADTFALGTYGGVRDGFASVLRRLEGNRSPWPTVMEGGRLVRWHAPPYPRHEGRKLQHLLKARPLEAILPRYRALQEAHPDDPTPWTYCGELWVWMGRYAEAVEAFEKAIEIQHSTTWAWIGWGAAVSLSGDPDRALRIWADGVEAADFEGPTLYVYRAEAHLVRGDLDAARADLDRALSNKPQRLSAWVVRALVEAAEGELDLAHTVLGRVREHAPGLAADLDAHVASAPAGPSSPSTPAEALSTLLGWMRGNRSSSMPMYVLPGTETPRFVRWRRGWLDPVELLPSVAAFRARGST